jgi:hypothetical protein
MTAASGFSASPRLRQSLRALDVDVVLTSRAAGVPVKQATLSDTDRRGNKFNPTDWDSSGARRQVDACTLATLSGEPRPGKRGDKPGRGPELAGDLSGGQPRAT